MRRSLSRLSKADLDFLMAKAQRPQIPSSIRIQRSAPEPLPEAPLQQLETLVFTKAPKHITSERISALFQSNHSLYTDPTAIDLIIKHYLWRQDFRTAQTFLLESLPNVQIVTVANFIETAVYESENSALVESVVKAALSRFCPTELGPVVARALVGYRYLQEHAKFTELHGWCRAHKMEFSTNIMQAKLFEFYLERRFDEALELGRTIKSRVPDSLAFPYKWALIVACRAGRFDAVQTTLEHAQEVCGELDPLLTNIMLSYSPPFTPQIEATEWFALCKAKGWPLNEASVLIMVDRIASRYPELGGRLWHRMNGVLSGVAKYKWPLKSPNLPQSQFYKRLRDANKAKNPNQSLKVISDMQRMGIVPSYEFYEHIFEALVKTQSTGELDLIKQQMEMLNYPVHCAGADLAVLEQQIAENNHANWARLLLIEYLTQYPLSVHDTLHLTRIALIYLKTIRDTESAAHVVDYRRLCTADQQYSIANHDAASLMVLMECRPNVDEFIYELLSHSPAIHLDSQFRRALRSNQTLEGSVRKVLLKKVSAHNEQLLERLLAEIDTMAAAINGGTQPS